MQPLQRSYAITQERIDDKFYAVFDEDDRSNTGKDKKNYQKAFQTAENNNVSVRRDKNKLINLAFFFDVIKVKLAQFVQTSTGV